MTSLIVRNSRIPGAFGMLCGALFVSVGVFRSFPPALILGALILWAGARRWRRPSEVLRLDAVGLTYRGWPTLPWTAIEQVRVLRVPLTPVLCVRLTAAARRDPFLGPRFAPSGLRRNLLEPGGRTWRLEGLDHSPRAVGDAVNAWLTTSRSRVA